MNGKNLSIVNFESRKKYKRKTHILQLKDDLNNIFSLIKKNMTNKDSKGKIRYNLNDNIISQETKTKENITDKIKITRCCVYCCFCCSRRRKIIQNILLDEGMNIISEKLDIFNIFQQLYKNEINPEKEKIKQNDIIEMSDNCVFKLNCFSNKLYHESESQNI